MTTQDIDAALTKAGLGAWLETRATTQEQLRGLRGQLWQRYDNVALKLGPVKHALNLVLI